jgi:hypothetical protein
MNLWDCLGHPLILAILVQTVIQRDYCDDCHLMSGLCKDFPIENKTKIPYNEP